MTIRGAIDGDIHCCCTCEHNVRHWRGAECTNRCDIDGHYIGYLACFGSVCDKWVLSEFEESAGRESHD